MNGNRVPKPREKLGKAGRRFWRRIHKQFVFEEEQDLERLLQASKCLDSIAEGEKTVENQGHFVQDRFGQLREHPGLKVVRDFRTLFLRACRELNLDLERVEDPRVPRQY